MNLLDVPIDTGTGAPLVLLHGYAMRPATYERLVNLMATRCRVVVPDLFAVRGRWRYPKVLEAFVATLDHLGLHQVSMLGHSFGGGIELGYAAHYPERVVETVFSDTLAVSRRFRLADEALHHPNRLLGLATPTAMSAFVENWIRHPRQLVGAAWWGFTSGRDSDSMAVVRDGIPSYVLWANRDSVLSRSDGLRFALELDASFTVASAPDGRALDHDWMFQQPDVFFEHLDALGLKAFSSTTTTSSTSATAEEPVKAAVKGPANQGA
jgi:pimeloyl-ACP methyl ester carboxylesterase